MRQQEANNANTAVEPAATHGLSRLQREQANHDIVTRESDLS